MPGTSHQTIRLARGRHKSPDDGACVMELASMLAGEAFSDRPVCVDRVIGAFLRAFNDRLGDRRRQELRPYAAAVVGSGGDRALTRARRTRCLEYVTGGPPAAIATRARLAAAVGVRGALDVDLGAGAWAAREAVARGDEDGGFALLDELLAVGGQGRRLEPAAFALP